MGVGGSHAAHAQDAAHVGAAAELLADQAFFAVGRLQHHGGRAVAEEHRDAAIGPVHELRDQLDADHHGIPHDAGADHRGRGREPVQKTGARGVDVHRRRVEGAQAHLDAGRRIRHRLVVRAAAVHDEIDVLRVEPGAGQRAGGGDVGELDPRDVRDTPLADARARHDPFVVRLHDRREIGVGEDRRAACICPTR